MKKIYKVMVFILMVALAIGSVVAAPITLLAAGPALVGVTFALAKMPKKGNVGEVVKLPKAKNVTAGSTVTVKVTDPYGKEIETTENGEYLEFTPAVAGKYKVVYTASAVDGVASKTSSEVYTVVVKGEKVVLSFGSNSPFIKQSRVGAESKMVLPYPTVVTTDVNGEKAEVEGSKATIKVTVKAPNLNAKWTETTDDADFTNPLSTVNIDGKDYYVFTPSKSKAEGNAVVNGTYEIFYTNIATNTTVSEKVQVSEAYSVENQVVDFTWEGSLPETAVLGNEVSLPKPVTVDKNAGKASVQTYTKVEVQYVNGEETKKYDVENFKFTPLDQAKNGSYYKLTYKIYTLEGLNLAAANDKTLDDAIASAKVALEKTYSLTNVTDTESPVAKAVLYNDADEIVEEDASYAIPSKAQTSEKIGEETLSNPIQIPAIYATDNYSEFADLTIKRELVDPDGMTYQLDGENVLNENYDASETKPMIKQAATNKNAEVYLRKAGTYNLNYTATDAAGNSATTKYTIVVVDDLEDVVKPNIVLPTIVDTIDLGETISFKDATIKDYKDDTKTSVVDTNMKIGVYYYYGQATNSADIEAKYTANQLTKLDLNDQSLYQIKVVDQNPEANYITVVFRAEDDGAYLGQPQNNVAYGYKVVKINQVSDDVLPVLATNLSNAVTAMDNVYDQGVQATIPNIEFTDLDNEGDASQSLVSTLKVYDANGKEITVSGLTYVYNDAKLSLQNGKFYTTTAGTYNVVITTTDLANNVLVNSFQFNVNDSEAPVIYVEDFDRNLELGKTYTIPAATVTDDSELKSNQIVFTDAQGRYVFNQGNRQFTAYDEGTYTFKYVAVDINDNERVTGSITLTVTSTASPEFELDEANGYNLEETLPEKGIVNIPFAKAEYADDIDIELGEIEVKVTGPKNTDVAVEKKDDHYEFNATQNGKYTITYKVQNALEKSFEKSYTISVGDLEAPVLKGTVIPGDFEIGDKLEIKLADLTVKDNVDGETAGQNAYNNKLYIKVVDPEGEEHELTNTDNVLSYEFTTAGDYTLKYTFKDEAENNDEALYSFKVNAASDKSSIGEMAWGAALIVAAVALVAGVVVYFVKTRDKTTDKDKKANKEEN